MKKMIKLCLISCLLLSLFFCLSDIAQAKGRSSGSYKSSSSGSKSIKVKSYYRKDGTYVPSHNRSAPKSKSTSITPNKSSKSSTPSPKGSSITPNKSSKSSTPSPKGTSYTPNKSSKSSTPSPKGSSITSNKSSKSSTLSSTTGVKRDSKGRIERSSAAKKEFLKSKGYDKVPEGYEVDHIVPLYKGGADEPSNMQLLPKDVHKEKTKIDLKK